MFVDPYAEIDEQLKTERENAAAKVSNNKSSTKKETAKGIDNLKPQRDGVGKYISNKLL